MPDSAMEVSLCIGGHELTPAQLNYVGSISYEEALTEMGTLEFSLSSGENLDLSDFPWQLGTEVELQIGWAHGDLVSLFVGRIQTVTPSFSTDESAMLNVICYDRGYGLRRVPPPKVYKEITHKKLVEDICRRHGLKVIIDPVDKLSNYKLEGDQAVTQVDETDFQILDAIAKRGNFNLLVHDDSLYIVNDEYMATEAFHRAVRPGSSARKFRFVHRGTDADLEQPNTWPLVTFDPEMGSEGQRTQVEVKSWAAVGEDGTKYGKGKLEGTPTKGQKYTEIVVKTETIETYRITGEAARDAGQAKYIAINEMERRARRFVKGEVVPAIGTPHLHIGMTVDILIRDLEPFGTMFSGEYVIETCRHEIDSEGVYTTSFDVRRDGITEP